MTDLTLSQRLNRAKQPSPHASPEQATAFLLDWVPERELPEFAARILELAELPAHEAVQRFEEIVSPAEVGDIEALIAAAAVWSEEREAAEEVSRG